MAIANTHFGAKEIERMLADCRSIYFIGIGGIHMSSLAHISMKRGFLVGGSDRTSTELTKKLEKEGIGINYNHNEENIEEFDAAVFTVAIAYDNPEYLRALEMGIPCISRADYLGYVMTGYRRRIGVSGMHGKSTCTSMCAYTFIKAGTNPTVMSGAELDLMDGAYRVGGGENFIFEACEYMDSFLDFTPTVAVILNIEMDHVDYFKDIAQIRRSFASYAALTGPGGFVVANGDNVNVLAALEDYEGKKVTFGIESPDVRFRARNIFTKAGCYSFDIFLDGEYYCHADLSVSGYHNIMNSLAACAVSYLAGISPEDTASGLTGFTGAKRRMEKKGTLGGAAVYDDYGHHPTEIKSTLEGAAKVARGRLICVFQPHTYSRTKAFFDKFAAAFDSADRVLFVDIYPAREKDTLGMDSRLLADAVGPRATYCGSLERAASLLASEAKSGDTVVIMGAGNVSDIFGMLELYVR